MNARFTPRHRVLTVLIAIIAIVAGDRLMSLSTQRELPRYSFAVMIEGRVLGAFREVTGLDVEFDIVEYRPGDGGPTQKLPGARKWPNIVLKRGFTGDMALHDWFSEMVESPAERVTGSIVMFDQQHAEVARWNFENAWPSKVTGPKLNSESNDVPIESIELVHDGLTRVRPSRQ